MKVFIAEDEPPARERLVATLGRVAPQAVVVGQADSVAATQTWLAAHPAPDVLLLDIQLADGLSLELFREGRLALPVIFTTAYDRFAIDAFQALAVDYLLKPVGDEALARALQKLERLKGASGDALSALLQRLQPAPPRRERLVGRQGGAFRTLAVERIAYVVSLDKLAVAVDDAGERYQLELPLAELEAQLDPARFFRANRQLIVAAAAVQAFVPVGRGRLKVELRPPLAGDALVSQERAAAFRAWLGG